MFDGVLTEVTSVTIGAVVSIVKVLTDSGVDGLRAVSVTVIVQLLYVPSARVLKVMVLVPTVALVVLDVHEPPYEMVPASFVVKE